MTAERIISEASEFVNKKEFDELSKYHNSMETFRQLATDALERYDKCDCNWCRDNYEWMMNEFEIEYERYQDEHNRLTEVPSYDHEEEVLMDFALAKVGREHADDPMDSMFNDWSGHED